MYLITSYTENDWMSIVSLFRRICKIAKTTTSSFVSAVSVCPSVSISLSVSQSVHMEQLSSHYTDFHEIWYWVLVGNLSRKVKVHSNLTIITGTLHEEQYTFLIISRSILRTKNVSDKSCTENHNTFYTR